MSRQVFYTAMQQSNNITMQQVAAMSNPMHRAGEQTRRQFFKHLRKVVHDSDVILEVLDARDPLACRSPALESMVLSADGKKRLILVLNKIDLVPAEVVKRWLVHLRREFPTVAFKASTQEQVC